MASEAPVYVVAFRSQREPYTYLIGGEELFSRPSGQPLFYLLDARTTRLSPPVMMGSITAHMVGVEWEEYEGSEQEEAAILEKFQGLLAADEKGGPGRR